MSNDVDELHEILNGSWNGEMQDGKVTINLDPGHVFAGNRSRLVSGNVTISEDTKWRQQLSSPNNFLTSVMSLPLYKYVVKRYHKN